MIRMLFLFALVGSLAACSKDGDKNPGDTTTQDDLASCRNFEENGESLTACIAPGSSTVLYYFHGLGGDPSLTREPINSFLRLGRQRLGARMPTIVSLSMGPEGILRDERAGFVRSRIAAIEAELPNPVTDRHLLGLSMGGHNALRTLMTDPMAFRSASLLCPALLDVDAYDLAEKAAYEGRHAADLDRQLFERAWALFHREFPTSSDWKRNNPFEALRRGDFTKSQVRFFVSTGRRDGLGFLEGLDRWTSQARKQGLQVNSIPTDGGHCSFNQPALLLFLNSQL